MPDDIVINIIKGERWERKIVPGSTALTHQKRFERRTCQHLFCASASVIVCTLAGYTYGICRNINFNVVLTAFSQEIDYNDNAHRIPHFVRNIFEEFAGVTQANYISLVITADIYFPALSICIAANPLKVFVFPFAFPFNILAFRHIYQPF